MKEKKNISPIQKVIAILLMLCLLVYYTTHTLNSIKSVENSSYEFNNLVQNHITTTLNILYNEELDNESLNEYVLPSSVYSIINTFNSTNESLQKANIKITFNDISIESLYKKSNKKTKNIYADGIITMTACNSITGVEIAKYERRFISTLLYENNSIRINTLKLSEK